MIWYIIFISDSHRIFIFIDVNNLKINEKWNHNNSIFVYNSSNFFCNLIKFLNLDLYAHSFVTQMAMALYFSNWIVTQQPSRKSSGFTTSVEQDHWEVPRHHLKILGILGEGCFGQVCWFSVLFFENSIHMIKDVNIKYEIRRWMCKLHP